MTEKEALFARNYMLLRNLLTKTTVYFVGKCMLHNANHIKNIINSSEDKQRIQLREETFHTLSL